MIFLMNISELLERQHCRGESQPRGEEPGPSPGLGQLWGLGRTPPLQDWHSLCIKTFSTLIWNCSGLNALFCYLTDFTGASQGPEVSGSYSYPALPSRLNPREQYRAGKQVPESHSDPLTDSSRVGAEQCFFFSYFQKVF